jgi:hypothetical protein
MLLAFFYIIDEEAKKLDQFFQASLSGLVSYYLVAMDSTDVESPSGKW